MSIPLAPRAGPSAQTTSQRPRTTSVLQLQNSSRRTAIPALSEADSEGPDVAQDIVHFNALLRKCGITVPIDGTADSEIHIEGISNYTVPDWQLPPESEDQPDLPTDTEDDNSDVEIVDDEEEADGSDNEHGDYITEEEAVQYATITLGEEIV
ncbi:hypothetical protein EV426DRAFT_645002 [Tirmania nivea]|nr:hypothetical protein EV426DRAFT_645002 [Tirmania nivea]